MNRLSTSILLGLIILLLIPTEVSAWGFWAHKRINRVAVFTLPPEMIGFYKSHIEFVTEHAVDADKRRYATEGEAPRHYIDLDHYGEYPFEGFPKTWSAAVDSFTEDTLLAYGIVPWHIHRMTFWLTDAFEARDLERILQLSADIGHYMADAHVPLHTTVNYNGQLTDQHGIHGFWESRLPELYGENYDYFVGKASYYEDPLEEVWKMILSSHAAVDTVLLFERTLNNEYPKDQKYSFEAKGQQTVKVYSEEYSSEYHARMSGMVERRMRLAVKHVGDIWFTCWVNAGQPDLNELQNIELTEEQKLAIEKEHAAWKSGSKIKGRPHPETGTDGLD